MTFAVVEPLQSDRVYVDDDERAASPSGAVELVVKVAQARRSGPRPGQRVDLGDRERASKRLAIGERLPAVAGALLAVCRCGLAIAGGLSAMLGGSRAELPGRLRCSPARITISAPVTARASSCS